MIPNRNQRALVRACAIAVIASGISCAQTYSSETRPHPGPAWPRLAQSDPTYWNIGDELVGFDRQPTSGARTPPYPIVTLHELAHHVPNRAAKEYRRALKADHKGDKEGAISHFQNAISLDPEFSAAINDLGITYLELDKTDLAIEQFSRAIIVDPRAVLPCSNLAIAYLRQTRYREAERTARRAVDIDRASTHGPLVLGVSMVLGDRFNGE